MENTEYGQALKLGEKAYRNAVAKGEYPFLPALDDILKRVKVHSYEPLGVVDIPLDQIVGTKTAGRQNAFAVNFMPLMKLGTEFASKWNNLCTYQMEQGNTDPIVVFEFLNKFYVQEGNKRVSVFKYLNASSIEGVVTRVIPKRNDSLENKIYYEFLDFYKCTKMNFIWFTKLGGFEALTRAVGKEVGEEWTEEEKEDFTSNYEHFKKCFIKCGGENLPITVADAFLFYISVYPYAELLEKSEEAVTEEVKHIWQEFTLVNQSTEETLVMDKVEHSDALAPATLLNKLVNLTQMGKTLKVGFLHNQRPEVSSWSYTHELGRVHLKEVFEDKIEISSYYVADEGKDPETLLDEMIADGNEIIFTANQKFLDASLKKALEHPEIKILNCSINRPHHAIRSYFGRMYEAKFLCGMVAGAMTENDKILYCADVPINGSFANVNAFALGAKMVNPRAKVYVHWMCNTVTSADDLIKEHDIKVVSYTDLARLSCGDRRFGLYKTVGDKTVNLAVPVWNWGEFYEKIVRDIMEGNWNRSADIKNLKAVNYWWGISSDILDLIVSGNVPMGVRTLIDIIRRDMFQEELHPFQGEITLQDGTVIGEEGSTLSPEQIITMKYYVENVVGDLPVFEELSEEAQSLILAQEGIQPLAE